MHSLPFDTVDLDADEVQSLEDTYKSLKAKFNIASPGAADVYLNKIELFNNNPEASLGGTLFINYPATNCYLNFVKSSFSYSYGGRGGNGGQNFVYDKYQVWAFVNLKRDCDRILIRKETFADRMLEIIHPIALKFKEDKVFSDNFYVVTNDNEKAMAFITSDFRKIMIEMMYKDFVIEIINKTLVIRNNQPINPDQTIHLAEIACKIASIN